MTHFSALSLLKNAMSGHKNWSEQWPDNQPKDEYDVIITNPRADTVWARPITWPRSMASPMSR